MLTVHFLRRSLLVRLICLATSKAAAWSLICACLVLVPRDAEAGQQPGPVAVSSAAAAATPTDLPFAIDGPPPPTPPDVVGRDASGRVTIRAVRLTAALRIDGRLDEEVYASVPAISDFIQYNPQANVPMTERTEVWVFFDRDHVYVSARCWDSHPERMVVNEMRRDGNNVLQNEAFGFMLDTFYDRRNAVTFQLAPAGGRLDGESTNEVQQYNADWNPVWDFAVKRFDGGWILETAVPFKSIRYPRGQAQIWGFNARRIVRWKNEFGAITAIPAGGNSAAFMMSSKAATLVGLEVPTGGMNLEIKPYAVSNVTSDLKSTPRISNDLGWNTGVDAKFGITQNLTADFTYNTDFAQVEADEQQVNLTRFSLFFPEKREFFLEDQGVFGFGGIKLITSARSSGAGAAGDAPILFYSRRIGLHQTGASQGVEVPIRAGGRLTGRAGRFSAGALNIQSGSEPISGAPSTNFSVVRVRRDVLRKSNIGAIFTGRSVRQNAPGSNEAYGVDGTFGFFDTLSVNTYWAQTRTDGLKHNDTSYRAQLDYNSDRYGVQLERLMIGEHFNPEVGFVRRTNMRRTFGQFRFSPRPRAVKRFRRYSWTGALAYIESGSGELETREAEGDFSAEFDNSDKITAGYSNSYERLPRPFPIAPGITLPAGGRYDYSSVQVGYDLGQQRRISGGFLAEYGTFYSGHKTALTFSRARMSFTPHFSVEPNISINWVDLVEGSFMTNLIGSRVTYTMTPRMFLSALLQYNSSSNSMATNIRLRWEYRPGSELFVVYNDQRDTLTQGFPTLANRAVIVKINRLFQF